MATTTRQALRQEIGRLTGDMLKCTATATGTTTTFIDKLRLYRGDGSMEGRIGWVAAGTTANLYSMVRVTGNTRSTFTVTFADTALTSATATGDVIEFWNERGQGYWPDDVNTEINAAITAVADQVTTPADTEIDDFDFDDPYVDIPAGWLYFGGAFYEDADGLWIEIPATENHMEIDTQSRTIRLKGEARRLADTYTVKLIGDIASTTLSADTDTTAVNPEWLTNYVAMRLMQPALRRSTTKNDDLATRLAFAEKKEMESRGRARTRPQGIARRLYS